MAPFQGLPISPRQESTDEAEFTGIPQMLGELNLEQQPSPAAAPEAFNDPSMGATQPDLSDLGPDMVFGQTIDRAPSPPLPAFVSLADVTRPAPTPASPLPAVAATTLDVDPFGGHVPGWDELVTTGGVPPAPTVAEAPLDDPFAEAQRLGLPRWDESIMTGELPPAPAFPAPAVAATPLYGTSWNEPSITGEVSPAPTLQAPAFPAPAAASTLAFPAPAALTAAPSGGARRPGGFRAARRHVAALAAAAAAAAANAAAPTPAMNTLGGQLAPPGAAAGFVSATPAATSFAPAAPAPAGFASVAPAPPAANTIQQQQTTDDLGPPPDPQYLRQNGRSTQFDWPREMWLRGQPPPREQINRAFNHRYLVPEKAHLERPNRGASKGMTPREYDIERYIRKQKSQAFCRTHPELRKPRKKGPKDDDAEQV